MDPKATTPIPNPLGTRFVATWPEDCSGWQIERHRAEGGVLPHISAKEYFAGLPNPLPSPALASFLACPGPYTTFELECDGQRKAVGVKLVAYGVKGIRGSLCSRVRLGGTGARDAFAMGVQEPC